MINLVKAGEQTGNMEETFGELRRYLEWLEQVMAGIKQASLYPAIVVIAVGLFIMLLFSFVVPKFAELLEGLDLPLPLMTRLVMETGRFFSATWWIWLLALPTLILAIGVARRRFSRFAYLFDELKLRLPLLGRINTMIALSRMTHNMGMLFHSGLPIIQAIVLCQDLVGNRVVARALERVAQDVNNGVRLGEAIGRHEIFPPLLRRMISVGENTGRLDTALAHVSQYYDEEIPRRVKKLFGILEPLITLILILVVGCVALAIFMPLLSLMGAVG